MDSNAVSGSVGSIRSRAVSIALMAGLATTLAAQTGTRAVPIAAGGQALVVGVADYDRSMDFYHDFMGLEFAAIPAPRAFRAVPSGIDDLYDNRAARFRNQLLRVPGSELGIELIQFEGLPNQPARVSLQNTGATFLSFTVRDLDTLLTRLKNGGAEIVSPGGQAVTLETKERAVVLKDPNGLFLRLVQPASVPAPSSPSAANILGMSMGVTIGDSDATMKLYRSVFNMDFRMGASFATDQMMAAAGMPDARYRKSAGVLPNSPLNFEFWEFAGVDKKPIALQVHDPGVAILRLRALESNIDLIDDTLSRANVPSVTRSRKPILWMGGTHIIMARDPNSLYWEFIGARP